MLIEQTLDKLNTMKLGAMADACQQQIQTAEAAPLSFEERFGLLVDANPSGRPASSASSSGACAPPSCAIRPLSRPSTSPILAGSTASRS